MKKYFILLFLGIFFVSSQIVFANSIITNSQFRIKLTFPSSWGKIKQKYSVSKTNWSDDLSEYPDNCPPLTGKNSAVWKMVQFTSKTDPGRSFFIHKIPKQYTTCFLITDNPEMALWKEKGQYAYYSGSSFGLSNPLCDMALESAMTSEEKQSCQKQSVIRGEINKILKSIRFLQPKKATTSTTAPQKSACEQSGGVFSQSKCQCPKEPQVNGASAFTYEENTGYCIDSFGIPGGKAGETAKKLLELQMLKNQ